MADDIFGNAQGGANVTYNPSTYKFTDPIRYFKANDPYYWEVDNIPLKQVQENILWLKDQVGAAGGGVIGKGSGTVLLGTSATTDVYMSSDSGASVHCNTIFLSEVASAKTYIGGHGQLWVKATSPNVLMFTDDAGTDFTVDVSSV